MFKTRIKKAIKSLTLKTLKVKSSNLPRNNKKLMGE